MSRRFAALFLVVALLTSVHAQQQAPQPRPVIGLALEGGGALGIAHIGVLQWMEEHRVPVDRMDGTSMGAIIGGLYATGRSPAELRQIALSDAITSVFTLETPYLAASFRRRQDRREIPRVLTIGLKGHYAIRNALLTDSGLNEFLNREFFNYNNANLDFDALPIPFRCVATDLTTLDAVTFRSGPIPQAVRASVSLPGIFPPVIAANGDSLVDGGIVDNLPTGVLRRELHADVVVAIHLDTGKVTEADTGSILSVVNRAFSAGVALNEAQSKKLADVVVNVPLDGLTTMDYGKGAALIAAGYKAAEENRTALLRYALPEAEWQAYLDARAARRLPAPGTLRAVRVEGGDPGAMRAVERDLKSAIGKPATADALVEGLHDVRSDGEYRANYEMFAVTPKPASGPADAGVLVRLQKEPGEPPYLIIGPEVAASTSNITRGALNLRLVYQGLGGYGSELRATVRVGYLTDLSAEYYRLLTPGGYFLEPQVRILRQPVYIWQNQKRVTERFQENLEAGLEAGRTVRNSLQVAAQWRALDTRWSLRSGSDGGAYMTGTAQTGLLRVTVDKAASDAVSPTAMRLSLAAGAFYHAVGSDNAPLVHASFGRTLPLGGTNILGIGVDISSYLRARVAEPFRFTLGGPLRLSASSFDEYRGTDTMLARAGLMHRLASLPTGLGQGLYSMIGYESGEIWSPDHGAILRQDGTAGVVAVTPVGIVSMGASVGDAGHRKVFFTVGRWF